MARKGVISLTFVLLFALLSADGHASDNQSLINTLTTLLRQSSIVILGENHQQTESPRLVADVVEAYLDAGGFLTVALEIASDQQAALDAGVLGEKSFSEIAIHPITAIQPVGYRD